MPASATRIGSSGVPASGQIRAALAGPPADPDADSDSDTDADSDPVAAGGVAPQAKQQPSQTARDLIPK
jgi:hypothetical protein